MFVANYIQLTMRSLSSSSFLTHSDEQASDKEGDAEKKKELKPRATWSYRRDMGQEAKDFESYIPCGSNRRRADHVRQAAPAVEYTPPDLSKYAGAKFRVANHVEKKKAALPLMIINQYVKKAKPGEGGGDAPPVQASSTTKPPAPPAGAKPPVKVVKISKEEYAKLLAQNKLKVLDANNPAGKVIKLQPGMQLKAMSSAATATSSLSSPSSPATGATPSQSPVAAPATPPTDKSQALPAASPGRKRVADGKAEASPAKKTTRKVDIKDRLRLINEKLGHKLKRGSQQDEDGSIITREETVYADSKVVNGQTILNVAASRGGSGSIDLGIGSSNADYGSPPQEKNGRYILNEPDSSLINNQTERKNPAEFSEGAINKSNILSTPGREKEPSQTSDHKKDSSEKASAVKKVRFSDQIEMRDSKDLEEAVEGEHTKLASTSSSVSSPSKSSSSSSSSDSQLSIYEKWKRRHLRSQPALFSRKPAVKETHQPDQNDESSRKRKHERSEPVQRQSDSDNEKDVEEADEEDEDEDSEDEPMMKYSKKGGMWLEGKTRGSKQQEDSFDKVINQDDQNGSMQPRDNHVEDCSSPTENGQCESSSLASAPDPEHRETFNEALHLQTKTDSPSLDHLQGGESTASLSSPTTQAHISQSKETINQPGPPPPPSSSTQSPSTSSNVSPAASSSRKPSSPPQPSLHSPSPPSSRALAESAAAQGKGFRLSGLTTQLALAMAQKRQQKGVDAGPSSGGEEGTESPPLLLPVGQEEPGRGGSREASPGDDDMPVLVPDQLPPSLVEPGQDNIFQRMMSPGKHKT